MAAKDAGGKLTRRLQALRRDERIRTMLKSASTRATSTHTVSGRPNPKQRKPITLPTLKFIGGEDPK